MKMCSLCTQKCASRVHTFWTDHMNMVREDVSRLCERARKMNAEYAHKKITLCEHNDTTKCAKRVCNCGSHCYKMMASGWAKRVRANVTFLTLKCRCSTYSRPKLCSIFELIKKTEATYVYSKQHSIIHNIRRVKHRLTDRGKGVVLTCCKRYILKCS